MKLKLLLGALLFSAVSANAQLASIDQNFNSFTAGNTTFPQNSWSAVLPAGVGAPPPMMVVYAVTGDASDKYVSAYSGANSGTPLYLVSPQIVAPTGNKTLTFKTRKNVAGAAVLIQAGLVSSPTDMSTFVPLGTELNVTSTTFQTVTIPVPSSTSTYIAFRTVNAIPGVPHTAADFDDVVYDTTPIGTINESFNSFTTGATALPQNGWNKVTAGMPHNVYIEVNNGSNAAQFYAANIPNATAYLIAPRIVAPDGSKKLRFTIGVSAAANGSSTLEAGMVTSPTDMASFTSLGAPVTITTSSTPQTITLDVPTSTKQYVAWKFVGAANHSAVYVDDVIYDVLASLGTSDIKSNTNTLNFVINANNEIQFVGKSNVKSVKVYSASGNLVSQGAVNNNRFDVSTLATGVYIFTAEDDNKTVSHSKFIKK